MADGRSVVFKILTPEQRAQWAREGVFSGAPIDQADGYIHFSAAHQVEETAAKHFKDAGDLVLVAVAADRLGASLRWEPSRGGDLFPHLYGPLSLDAVLWEAPMPRQTDGTHLFPDGWRDRVS